MSMASVTKMEVIGITSDSVNVASELTTDKNPAEQTTGHSGSVCLDSQGEIKASPTDTMENSQAEKPAKGRKGKKVCALFRRVWKAIKHPFLCCDPDRVVSLGPQPGEDDSERMSVSSSSRNTPTTDTDPADPELVCLPGQVCEDPESLYVLAPSRIERTPDTDSTTSPEPSPVPDPTSSDLADDKPRKRKKRKAVCACFRKICKTVKNLFPRCNRKRKQQHLTQPDDTEPMPDQDPSKSTDSIEPESENLSDQFSESSSSYSSTSEIGLPYGSLVSLFQVGDLIGSGSFGIVYKGNHIFNEAIKVAIKYVLKHKSNVYLNIEGHSKPVPSEVAMLLRLGKPPLCPNIIKLHHWVDKEDCFILIMEYPEPCQTLAYYIMNSDDMNEEKARWLMRQFLQAVKHCVDRVVTVNSLRLILIDFGSARPVTSEGFNSSDYQGALCYTPPEVIRHTIYHSNPANVWALGIVLFEIMHGYLPFGGQEEILRSYVDMKPTLSSACRDLIFNSLIRNPANRLTLKLEEHRWFNPPKPDSKQSDKMRLDMQQCLKKDNG